MGIEIKKHVNRFKRGLAVAGAVVVASASLPSVDAPVHADNSQDSNRNSLIALNSANCLSIGTGLTNGGPIESRFAMNVDRFYTLYESGKPVRDITSDLMENPGAVTYDDLDWEGNKVGEVSKVQAYYSDYKISLEGGEQAHVLRARYDENQLRTRAYELVRGDNAWVRGGEVLTFSKDKPDGQIEITNGCGQKETRDGFKVEKWRVLKDGVVRRINNAVVWLARDCILYDEMDSNHYLRPQDKPVQPVVEAPTPSTPNRRPQNPPAQVPAQLPRSGDGSTEIPNQNPNIPRYTGQ